MVKGKYVRWMRGHIVVAARDHNWQKQQCDPFPKIDHRWQGRLEMETCFCSAILGNGNGNTFLLQAWTWTPWWQVMQEGDGPVMNQLSPLIQRRLSCRPRLFGIASRWQGRLEKETVSILQSLEMETETCFCCKLGPGCHGGR